MTESTVGGRDDEFPSDSLIARLQAKYGEEIVAPPSIVIGGHSGSGPIPLPGALRPEGLERYELGPEIGRGGMGSVLEVWDKALDRPLAMKVLLDGAEADSARRQQQLIQRFVREARITGQLDHPGIIPVHDLDLDEEGRVFFTMRRVRGQDLGAIFRKARANEDGWTESRALEAFLKVCDTVAYAHSRGVVHRDLKPANVMVGDYGEVYVLDWGLAKVVDRDDSADDEVRGHDPGDDSQVTMAGAVMGTPSYMAPEQAEGAAITGDPRLDVYSIGAILYTLSTGHAPYAEAGTPISSREILVAVRRGPPRPLRELRRDLPEGLVAICERAMARDPGERYATASEIARDLRDHLEREHQQAEETRRLRAQLDDSESISEFLKSLFRVRSPSEASQKVSLTEILERGGERLDRDFSDQPALRASVHAALGEVHQIVGSYRKGLFHCQTAVDLTREHALSAELDEVLARRLEILAFLELELGQYEQCERNFLEAINIHRRRGASGEALANPVSGLGYLYFKMGRLEEAREAIGEALGIRRTLPDELALGNSLVQQAVILNILGDPDGAEAHYHEVIAMRTRSLGRRNVMVATSINNLGTLSFQRGDFERAVEWYREAVSIREETMGLEHPKYILACLNLSSALLELGEVDEPEALCRRCLDTALAIFKDDEHPDVVMSLEHLGRALTQKGALDEADDCLTRARTIAERRLGPANPRHEDLAIAFGLLRERQGRPDEARTEFERALSISRTPGEPLVPRTADSTFRYAQFILRTGHPDEARPLFEECLAAYLGSLRPSDPIVTRCRTFIAQCREG